MIRVDPCSIYDWLSSYTEFKILDASGAHKIVFCGNSEGLCEPCQGGSKVCNDFLAFIKHLHRFHSLAAKGRRDAIQINPVNGVKRIYCFKDIANAIECC